ncbi:TonB family protein [Cytophagaceae bacterium DM2B3-1]|uniref:TonB family protein n=1 Tax=Xanthocytophaga flava TaxID=3048013 RepID=A0AAE3QKS3_9BACT|nr:TonB family protein [Xanthocytophaga flavus]MDJ1468068.1 TonB family protein [Xanthocytophaga flavus]MDJ1481182.1 TonB family protein [Xanthocytophaga flavus]MDJ1495964.1 TonB family protein [Xanthocytophaga flavus]
MKIKVLVLFLIAFGVMSLTAQAQNKRIIPVAEYYEGGQEKLLADIQQMIQYPPTAKRNRIQGECLINFVLEADGKTSSFKLVKEIGGGCGAEAMRIAGLLKFKAPGYRMDVGVPIKFVLPKP